MKIGFKILISYLIVAIVLISTVSITGMLSRDMVEIMDEIESEDLILDSIESISNNLNIMPMIARGMAPPDSSVTIVNESTVVEMEATFDEAYIEYKTIESQLLEEQRYTVQLVIIGMSFESMETAIDIYQQISAPSLDDSMDFMMSIMEGQRQILNGESPADSNTLKGISIDIEQSLEQLNEDQINTAKNIYLTMAAGVIVAVALCIVLALVMDSSIGKPLRELTNIAKKVVYDGDLDANVEIDSNDEIGELADMYRRLINTTKNAHQILESMNQDEGQG